MFSSSAGLRTILGNWELGYRRPGRNIGIMICSINMKSAGSQVLRAGQMSINEHQQEIARVNAFRPVVGVGCRLQWRQMAMQLTSSTEFHRPTTVAAAVAAAATVTLVK